MFHETFADTGSDMSHDPPAAASSSHAAHDFSSSPRFEKWQRASLPSGGCVGPARRNRCDGARVARGCAYMELELGSVIVFDWLRVRLGLCQGTSRTQPSRSAESLLVRGIALTMSAPYLIHPWANPPARDPMVGTPESGGNPKSGRRSHV